MRACEEPSDDISTANNSVASSLFHIVPTDQQGEYVPEAQVSLRLEHKLSDSVTLHACNTRAGLEQSTLNYVPASSDDTSSGFHLFFASKRNEHDALIMMPLQKDSKVRVR